SPKPQHPGSKGVGQRQKPRAYAAAVELSCHGMVNQSTQARSGTLVVLEGTGTEITSEANTHGEVLLLGANPLISPWRPISHC
ncbi:MAG: hypothetical protein EAY75_12785, partial [Bacteroidetes bacterium]